MSGKVRPDFGPAIDLASEPDFTFNTLTVRPSASEVVVDAVTRRIEPRVMQTLVALVQANESVVSRDELMTRCWSGVVVGEDAITRAVGQVRRLAALAPTTFTVETIPKIGYRLVRAAAAEPRSDAGRSMAPALKPQTSSRTASIAVAAVAALVIVAGVFAFRLADSPPPAVDAADQLGTRNPEARDRQLRASALLGAGGRDNALRAEQLLREALALDPSFHTAKEALVVALLSAAAFAPERAGEAHAEITDLLDSEIVETPLAWRAHVMRGFQHVFQGDWAAAERALEKARSAAPEQEPAPIGTLETFLLGNLGRLADSLELVIRQAQEQPLSRDQSRVLQQWLDRTGQHEEAEAEYIRSRDLPGDRSAMELAALVRALGTDAESERVTEQLDRYRETDWGRAGDDALAAVHREPSAAIPLLRDQIEKFNEDGAMPPFLAAAWTSYYGDTDLAVDGLRAHPESLFAQAGLIWDPVFANTRRTAAFKAFLRDFGYVDYWRAHGWGDFCRPAGENDFECR